MGSQAHIHGGIYRILHKLPFIKRKYKFWLLSFYDAVHVTGKRCSWMWQCVVGMDNNNIMRWGRWDQCPVRCFLSLFHMDSFSHFLFVYESDGRRASNESMETKRWWQRRPLVDDTNNNNNIAGQCAMQLIRSATILSFIFFRRLLYSLLHEHMISTYHSFSGRERERKTVFFLFLHRHCCYRYKRRRRDGLYYLMFARICLNDT